MKIKWHPWRIPRRIICHGTVWCCQYQDGPLCNGGLDPHRVSRYLREHRALRAELGDNSRFALPLPGDMGSLRALVGVKDEIERVLRLTIKALEDGPSG